ncbi:MAG TPA: AI-2E family transporter [Roseiarcus sp.]|nr:AI-2E family transporter [Roseiarcus sp.]
MRAIPPSDEGDPQAKQIDRLRQVSTWSLAILATIATGAVLYFARELLLPIVTAFVVGVMLSPVVRRLEERRVPRAVSAALIVICTALLITAVAALIATPIASLTDELPKLGGKLQVFHGAIEFIDRMEWSVGINPTNPAPAVPAPSIEWVPTTIGLLSPPLTGFVYFLIVLLLFLSWWPDLRRALVMTFASRDSRLTVLRILNDTEALLARYLATVAIINLGVGVAAGVIALATGLPSPIGIAALGATLNFIPIVGPFATIIVLALVGVVTAPTLGLGLLPAASFAAVVFLEGQLITPAIIGRRLEINSLAVLLSLLFWTWMWGSMGAFLSSPILIVGLILKEHLTPDATS